MKVGLIHKLIAKMVDFEFIPDFGLSDEESYPIEDGRYHIVTPSSKRTSGTSTPSEPPKKRGRKATLTEEEKKERVRQRNARDRERYAREKQGLRDEILFLKQQIQQHKDRTALLFEHLRQKAANHEVVNPDWLEQFWFDNNLSDFIGLLLD